ncbi:MAG: hypothetical protein ACLQQ4_08920 [Bacteroidia bacterium]
MEAENEIRGFIRQTLNEVAANVLRSESDNTMADIVRSEEAGSDTLNEKNQLDDRTKQGVDKIFAKVNDKIG